MANREPRRDSPEIKARKSAAQQAWRGRVTVGETPEQIEAKRMLARQCVQNAGLPAWKHMVDRAVELKATRHDADEIRWILIQEFGKAA